MRTLGVETRDAGSTGARVSFFVPRPHSPGKQRCGLAGRFARMTMQPTTISSCKDKESMILQADEKGYVLSAADTDRAPPQDLTTRYRTLLDEPRLSWIETHRMRRRLG